MEKNVTNDIEVSIIMPAYNASKYLQAAINSVINQTFSNWELIIIDDGSTDETSSIINKNAEKDNRIRGFYQINGKQGKARNLGIENANGSFIAFLDADDLWLPNKLEIQLSEIKNRQVDLVFSNSYIFYNNEVLENCDTMQTISGIIEGLEAFKLFLICNRIPILTVLVKKEHVNKVNNFSEKLEIQLAEDYHLWLKLIMNKCKFYGSEHVLAAYRIHDMASTKDDKLANKQIIEVLFDLAQDKTDYKQIIEGKLKYKLQQNYNNTQLSRAEFSTVINNVCKYLNKKYLCHLFKILNIILGPHITRKILNLLLNVN
ncbi:MAG: glycosyltransferase family 2 protein [Winogradskyella sp.]|uniref:glycosyltransferase family 2 protein n=1 Tax=Winogradskyella sp. TaxID=1883156 RepID=UPI0017BF74A3|nr:glycosyltransferase family 2 protein [Winogradskyella sp.]